MIVIIWRRWGILMPVICILGAVLADFLFHPHGRAESIYFFLPAVLVSLTGVLLDKQRQPNDFFFVPMKYWGILVAAFGVAILIYG
jgi:hypothetical protein